MARGIHRLSAAGLKTKPVGMHADGGGLYLKVASKHSRSWVFRYMIDGTPRYMGLGSLDTFSLADARDKARDCRQLCHEGIDPITARDAARDAAKLETAKAITFKSCGESYIDAHKAGWRNSKHSVQWKATLETYAYPIFGDLPVQSVDTGLVMKALSLIWTIKPETASRLRGRVEKILDWATARGFRKGDNPARWRGHLDNLLPRRSKVAAVEHQPAVPYQRLPAFIASLRTKDSTSAKALEFLILTATRTGETIGARSAEIDLREKVWTIPASRTKANKEHRVPLSARAVEIIGEMKGEYLFAGPGGRRPLSNMALLELMRGMRDDDGNPWRDAEGRQGVPHGFRSSFRDWAGERTNFPREVAEMALAHVVKDKTEAAYRRGDALAKRRQLMDAWARYCETPAGAGQVASIHRVA